MGPAYAWGIKNNKSTNPDGKTQLIDIQNGVNFGLLILALRKCPKMPSPITRIRFANFNPDTYFSD